MSRAIVVVVWSGLLVVSVFLSLLVWSCRLLLSLLVWYSCLVMGGRLHRPPPVGRTYFFASILSYPILSYPILSYPILSRRLPSFLSRTFGISHVLYPPVLLAYLTFWSCLVLSSYVLYFISSLVSSRVLSRRLLSRTLGISRVLSRLVLSSPSSS